MGQLKIKFSLRRVHFHKKQFPFSSTVQTSSPSLILFSVSCFAHRHKWSKSGACHAAKWRVRARCGAESKVQPVGCRLTSPRQKFRAVAAAADEDKRLGAKVHTRELIYKFGEKISYYSAQSVSFHTNYDRLLLGHGTRATNHLNVRHGRSEFFALGFITREAIKQSELRPNRLQGRWIIYTGAFDSFLLQVPHPLYSHDSLNYEPNFATVGGRTVLIVAGWLAGASPVA